MNEESVAPAEKYQLLVWMQSTGPQWRYSEEHWFEERPEREIVQMLFEEAKSTFRVLYPDAEPGDFAVSVTRLRPRDNLKLDLSGLAE